MEVHRIQDSVSFQPQSGGHAAETGWRSSGGTTIQKIPRTVEIPQVWFIDKDPVDVPVVFQRQVQVIQKEQRTVEVPQIQYIAIFP